MVDEIVPYSSHDCPDVIVNAFNCTLNETFAMIGKLNIIPGKFLSDPGIKTEKSYKSTSFRTVGPSSGESNIKVI